MKNQEFLAKKLLYAVLCLIGVQSLGAATHESAILSVVNRTGMDIRIRMNFPSRSGDIPSLISCHTGLQDSRRSVGQLHGVRIDASNVVQYQVPSMVCLQDITVAGQNGTMIQDVMIQETDSALEGCIGEAMGDRLLIITRDGDRFNAVLE